MTDIAAPSESLTAEHAIIVRAGAQRVWQALTQEHEMAQWFCSKAGLDVRPGGTLRFDWVELGPDNYTGGHDATVEAVEPNRRLAFRWQSHPDHPETLVEFLLEPRGPITVVRIRESGFGDNAAAAKANTGGWAEGLAWLQVWIEHAIAYPHKRPEA